MVDDPKLRGAEHEIQNKDPERKESLRKSTRCTMHAETTEASETHVFTEGAHELARRYAELENRFTKQTMRQRHRTQENKKDETTEASQLSTSVAAAKTEGGKRSRAAAQDYDSMTRRRTGKQKKEEELKALNENIYNMDKKVKAQAKDISKKIKQGIRDNKRTKRRETVQRILEQFKGIETNENSKTGERFLITRMRNEVRDIKASRKGIANTFAKFYEVLYSSRNDERKRRQGHRRKT